MCGIKYFEWAADSPNVSLLLLADDLFAFRQMFIYLIFSAFSFCRDRLPRKSLASKTREMRNIQRNKRGIAETRTGQT